MIYVLKKYTLKGYQIWILCILHYKIMYTLFVHINYKIIYYNFIQKYKTNISNAY